MARTYGTLEVAFWDDPAAKRLSQDAIQLYIYLRSCKHGSAASAFVMPMLYVDYECRLPKDRALLAFKELSVKPFVLRDPATEVVWLPNVLGTEGNKMPNQNMVKHITKTLMALPDCQLKVDAIDYLLKLKQFVDTIKDIVGDWKFDNRQRNLGLDLDSTPARAPEPPKPAKARETRDATRISPDWKAPEEYISWAHAKGFTDEQIRQQESRFVRHFTSADCKKPAKKDWYATWQNWFDKETPRGSSGSNGNGAHPPAGGEASQWTARMNSWRDKRMWLVSWGPEPGKQGCEVPSDLLAPE